MTNVDKSSRLTILISSNHETLALILMMCVSWDPNKLSQVSDSETLEAAPKITNFNGHNQWNGKLFTFLVPFPYRSKSSGLWTLDWGWIWFSFVWATDSLGKCSIFHLIYNKARPVEIPAMIKSLFQGYFNNVRHWYIDEAYVDQKAWVAAPHFISLLSYNCVK